MAHVADWGQVKAFVEEWDLYGYGRRLRNQPMESPDDGRNWLVLCERHPVGVDHEDGGSGTGIHELTFPIWVVQWLGMSGQFDRSARFLARSCPILRDLAVPANSDGQRSGGVIS